MSTDDQRIGQRPIVIAIRDDLVTDEPPAELRADFQRVCDEKAPGYVAQFVGWTKTTAPAGYTYAVFEAIDPKTPPEVGQIRVINGHKCRVTAVELTENGHTVTFENVALADSIPTRGFGFGMKAAGIFDAPALQPGFIDSCRTDDSEAS